MLDESYIDEKNCV